MAHALDPFEEPAGGGAVAAVQLARLAGTAELFTVFGKDSYGERSSARLGELGVEVTSSASEQPTRRAVTLVEDGGERTITTFGERLDPLGGEGGDYWSGIADVDGVYFTAGDLDALEIARDASKVLVASPRARHALGAGVRLDALVLSGDDEIELREAAARRSRGRRGHLHRGSPRRLFTASALAPKGGGRPRHCPGCRSTPTAVGTPLRPASPTGSPQGSPSRRRSAWPRAAERCA